MAFTDEAIIASQEISGDRNFWLAKVAGHGRNKLGQFGILSLEIALTDLS